MPSSDRAVKLVKELFYWIGFYGGLAGVNMTRPNYRPTTRTWILFGFNVSYMFSSIWTSVTYDSESAWRGSNNMGIAVQGVAKYIVLFTFHQQIFHKMMFLQSVYERNTETSTKNYEMLCYYSEKGRNFAKYGSIPVLWTALGFLFYPIYTYIFHGERTVIVYLMYPGSKEDTLTGYCIVTVYHINALLMAWSGTCGSDFMLLILIVHLWPLSYIIENMTVELNKALKVKANQNTAELKQFFYNLVRAHLDMCQYLEDISHIYFYILLIEIYTLAWTLCSILYCMFNMTYAPLYLMAALFFFQLFFYCLLGTVAEMAMDRTYMSVSSILWYLLPLNERRAMILMIAKAQNPTILMAGTMPLNMDSFVQVMKTIYSVGMLLLGNE